jgi:hypothetical protein
VKFIVKDEPGKCIFAHKSILVQRSPYFRAVSFLVPIQRGGERRGGEVIWAIVFIEARSFL